MQPAATVPPAGLLDTVPRGLSRTLTPPRARRETRRDGRLRATETGRIAVGSPFERSTVPLTPAPTGRATTDFPAAADQMDQPDGSVDPTVDPPRRPWDRLRAGTRRWGLFVAGVAAAFLAIALYGVVAPPDLLTADEVQTSIKDALASMTPAPARSQVVYDAIRPSLVLIQTDLETGGAPSAEAPSPSLVRARRTAASAPASSSIARAAS